MVLDVVGECVVVVNMLSTIGTENTYKKKKENKKET